jgi:hypothetical protein
MTANTFCTPIQLSEKILEVVEYADDDTAHAALEITHILLRHRKLAEINFVAESRSET